MNYKLGQIHGEGIKSDCDLQYLNMFFINISFSSDFSKKIKYNQLTR